MDKQGDIYCANALKLNSWVLMGGHTASVITDMQIIHEGSLLATSDRDEKIRISQFPELYQIKGYCMGHTSVISSLCEATTSSSRRLLVSGGWEHKLCTWDALEGRLLSSISTSNYYEEKRSEEVKEANTRASEDEDEVMDENDGVEGEKIYDATAAGPFPNKVRSMQVEGHNGDCVLVTFNESSVLHVYSLSEEGELCLKATYNAPATVLDFACMSGGRLLLLLPGNHHLEVLTLTASECSKFTISPKLIVKD